MKAKRLTEPQRLALEAINDGALDYAHPRTVSAISDRGLIVYLGSGGTDARSFRLTDAGTTALEADRAWRGYYYDQQKARLAGSLSA